SGGVSGVTTVSIVVDPVDDAPTVQGEGYATDEDVALVVDAASGVLANDTDPEGLDLTASLVQGPAHGTLDLASDGAFTYTPADDWNGTVSFTYAVSDGNSSVEAVATVVVAPVNDVVTLSDSAFSTDEDEALAIAAGAGLLAGLSDPDGDALRARLVSGPAQGALSLFVDGSFSYTP